MKGWRDAQMAETMGVGEAKRRFSELLDRVKAGERFVVLQRGKPAMALVPPDQVGKDFPTPAGLLSIVGSLADWPELEGAIAEVYTSRRRSRNRAMPDLG